VLVLAATVVLYTIDFFFWMMLGRLALFSAVEAGIVVLALQLRKSIEPGNWGRLIAIGFGFAVWEWISQTMISLLYRLGY